MKTTKKRLQKILPSKELSNIQNASEYLINAALPYMLLMAETFRDCGSILALINRECYILKLIGPSHTLLSRKKLGLKEGSSLREEHAGTNAAWLSLENNTPFYLMGNEYYFDILKQGSCFAAPIIREEQVIGGIIIIHPQRMGHPHTFALVQTLAQLISREYQAITEGSLVVSVCNLLNTGIIVTERNGYIWYTNSRARQILGFRKKMNMFGYFDTDLFSSTNISNEIVYSKNKYRSYLVTRKNYNDKFLFMFEPIEDELEKRAKIKTSLAPYSFEDIFGLNDIKKKARSLAAQNVNILICGESGTGKELFASAIHNNSPRATARFIVVNCAAIPETLFESELFGYKKGAFTDARFDRIGKIEYASGGTLFLDEIGELPLNVQSKLLRVIEDKSVTPLGSNKATSIDVRFIFASNRSLEKLISQKNFREDLYYRISSPVLKIPPLRIRKDEIPGLIEYFLQKVQRDHKRFITGLSKQAVARLMQYHYPGNVRELQGILKNAYLTCRQEKIDIEDLEIPKLSDSISLKERLAEYASGTIKERLLMNNFNVKATARELNISQRTIYRYLKKINHSSSDRNS